MLATLLLLVALYFHTFIYFKPLLLSAWDTTSLMQEGGLRGIFQTKFCLLSLLAQLPNFILKIYNLYVPINKIIEGIFKRDFPF